MRKKLYLFRLKSKREKLETFSEIKAVNLEETNKQTNKTKQIHKKMYLLYNLFGQIYILKTSYNI